MIGYLDIQAYTVVTTLSNNLIQIHSYFLFSSAWVYTRYVSRATQLHVL